MVSKNLAFAVITLQNTLLILPTNKKDFHMLYKKWRKLEEFYTWIDLFIINLFCKSEVERLIRIIATILTWDSKSVLEIRWTPTQFFKVEFSSYLISKEDLLRCETWSWGWVTFYCHSLKLGVEMPFNAFEKSSASSSWRTLLD